MPVREFRKPAVLIQQGKKKLFTTAFTVNEFMIPNFYTIDKLDTQEEKGFQRILQEECAKRLAKYMVESWKQNGEAFLPSSIFMATDKTIEFDEASNEIYFDTDICPFSVVDGQHRIEGLKRAALTNKELENFSVPVNIAVNLTTAEQMLHFYVVNTTQRSVDPAVGNRILARLHHMRGTEDVPYIPSWMKRRVDSDADAEAIRIISRLNSDASSPWRNKIQLPDEAKKKRIHTVAEKSLVVALKSNVLVSSHSITDFPDEKRDRILINYWRAVSNKFTTEEIGNDTVVFKSTGAWFFSRISSAVISRANRNASWKVTDFEEIFDSVKEILPNELLAITFPDWWRSGGGASGWNKTAADKAAIEFSRCVNSLGKDQMDEL